MIEIEKMAPGLVLGADGIWYAARQRAVSYPVEGHASCFDVEEASFWFAHRNRCITALLAEFPPAGGGPLLDIGGGNGFVSRSIEKTGIPVILIEPGLTGARNAKRRGLANVVCAPLEEARFAKGSVAAAGLFDVIEHLEDPVPFLASVRSVLPEKGRLYLTVPAFPILWSEEDEVAGHFRRYTRRTLDDAVQEAGFTPEFATFIFRPLPLPVFLLRTVPFRLGWRRRSRWSRGMARDHAVKNRSLGRVLERLLAPEIESVRRRRPARFGASILMVAQA